MIKPFLADSNSLSSTFLQNNEKKLETWQQAFIRFIPTDRQDPNKPQNSSYWTRQLYGDISLSKTLTTNQKILLTTLLSLQGKDGQLNAGNKCLAEAMGKSETIVKRTLRSLIQSNVIICTYYYPTRGFITIKRRQISVCWNSSMIRHRVETTLDSCFSSSLNSSSVLDLKSLDNVVSHKPTACSSFASNLSDSSQLEAVDNKPLISPKETNSLNMETRMIESTIDKDLEAIGYKESAAAPKKEFKPLISWQELVGEGEEENVGISANKLEDRIADAIEREIKSKPRHLEIVKRPWEEEQPITKEKARRERIDDIPNRYPNYKEVLGREDCTLAEIKTRMRANEDYEPFTKDQKWDLTCHPKYAILSEQDKDRKFIKSVEFWMGEPKHGYRKNIRTMLKKGRKQADSCRAEYGKYVMSIYEHYGLEMELWKFGWKTGWEVYLVWVENGEPRPQNRGYNARQNRELVKREFGRKRGFVKRKSMAEEVEEQREALKLEQDEITRAYSQ